MIKAVDLFCGIGGLTNGFIKSGIHVVAGIDLDETCKYAYTTNNRNKNKERVKFIHSSVSDVSSDEIKSMLEGADYTVLVGCAPCQPFSNHQKDKLNRNTHDKWGLLYDFSDHIRNVRPDIVSMENVPTLEKEIVFKDFVKELEDLGYFVDYKVVNAADYGVPQRRRRLLLLASRIGVINLIEPTNITNHISVRDAIGNLTPIIAGQTDDNDKLHRSSKLTELNLKRIRSSKPGGTWKDWDPSLLPNCYKKISGKTYSSVYGRMKWDEVAPTLTTQFGMYGTGRFGHPEQDRALSLREGALLQSFPKKYKFFENEKYSKTIVSRHIGNAVPVRLGEIIGLSIINHIK